MPSFTGMLLAGALGYGIYSSEKARREAKEAEPPPLPEPEPPVAIPETGEGEVTRKRKLIKAGRAGTILTGQLAPENIGKKGVLGY